MQKLEEKTCMIANKENKFYQEILNEMEEIDNNLKELQKITNIKLNFY